MPQDNKDLEHVITFDDSKTPDPEVMVKQMKAELAESINQKIF